MTAINRLLDIMARLRDPQSGCPWDLEQDFKTIAPYTVEEAYEVADAIDRGDMKDLKEELGDLLLQVVFHAQMAREKNLFDFDQIVNALCDKLIYRHPHVFGEDKAANASEVLTIWNARKDAEKTNESAIDGVTLGLPALLRAYKLQKKAGKSGFVWPNSDAAWKKFEEELLELKSAKTPDEEADEIGDVLFCLVNYARLRGFDAEQVLTVTNKKFELRFKAMEKKLAANDRMLENSTLDEKLTAWKAGKVNAN
jgi:nucleoside triphosphate diphosphatase